jgi:tetratricopeptide (TPR) repeat protein
MMDIQGPDEHAAAAAREALGQSDDPSTIDGLARLLLIAKDFDGAIEAANRALAGNPNLSSAMATRGAAQAELGRYAMAERDLESALKALGPNPWLIHRLVLVHVRQGVREYELRNLAGAQQHLQRAVELDPSNSDARRWLGEVLRLEGDNTAALEHLDAALEAMGADPHPDRAWTLATRGQVLRNLGRLSEAEKSLQESLEIDGTLDWALAELGELLRSAGRPQAAVKVLQRAVESDPLKAAAWDSLGVAQAELELYRDALDSLDEALKLRPNDPWTLAVKANVLLDCDELEEALAAITVALDRDPSRLGWAQLRHGLILELLGRPLEDVESVYEHALKAYPADNAAKTRLADIRLLRNKISEAVQLWREVVGTPGRDVPVSERADVGWSLMRLGKYEAAAVALGTAAAADTTGVSNYFDLGLDFLLWGRTELAVDHYVDATMRVQGVPDLGRRRFFLRLAEHNLGKALHDPRRRDRVDGDAVKAIRGRLAGAKAGVAKKEARRSN